MAVYIYPPVSVTTLPPVGGASAANQLLEIADLDAIKASAQSLDTKTPALGQALAAASVPVVMTAAQLATLTPPAAITGFALEAGHIANVDSKIPAQGQALAAASMPVVLPVAQITALTPPAAITGFALESTQLSGNTLIGAVTETAPATDTASSGLNGRLQRIAQRITSLIALFPASLGSKADASSFAVTWATEDKALAGSLTETAPASDTASSGLNGRLQRIAQRITSLIALFPTALGQGTMATSFKVVIASDQTAIPTTSTNQSVAGTPSTAQISVGLTAVRATVAGTAPSASRKYLSIKPSKNNTGAIYIGGSTVTTANGQEIIGPDCREFAFDTGDYYLISDTASQTVEILEKV